MLPPVALVGEAVPFVADGAEDDALEHPEEIICAEDHADRGDRRRPRATGVRSGKDRELADQLFRMRIQKSMGQLEAPDKMRTVRRDLARVKTVLRQKQAK